MLWLDGPLPANSGVIEALRERLGPRALSVPVRAVPVLGPSPGRNPWAVRQDRQDPLRWGEGEGLDGATTLADALQRVVVGPLHGVVFAGICAQLADQPLRTLLRQLAPQLVPDAPWLAYEPNGRSARSVSRSLASRRTGEGQGTVRTVEELRRLFETGGLGIEGAWGAPATRLRDRIARRALGDDVMSDWLVVAGRAIRGGEDLR